MGALAAARGGLSVLVAEKSRYIGGTSAMSGGCAWIPCNHHMARLGETDSPEEALTYIRSVAPPGWAEREEPLWQAFVRNGPEMLRFAEANSPLRFGVGLEPDAYAEAPGGKRRGRNVSPRPIAMRAAGALADRIRPTPALDSFTYNELADTQFMAHPFQGMLRFGLRSFWRKLRGQHAMGTALIVGLVRGCQDAGAEIMAEAPARELIAESDRVIGARIERQGRTQTIRARRGVLLATGGFEWNAEMMARYLPGPVELIGSPDTNTGDGQRMAEAVGAKLDRMDQSLIYPTKQITYEGRPHGAPTKDLKLPHIMLVNKAGRRFVNEVQINIGLAFEIRDPETRQPVNLPAWRIFDRQYARKYPHALPATRKPPLLYQADSLRALAALIDVDPAGLEDSARRMGDFARRGRDDDFGRGTHIWDTLLLGDQAHRPNPVLGTIERPPFYAVPFRASYLGTKGGPRTNEHGQVLRPDGSRIAGLYAAGNVMANPIGSKAVGAGTTIGPVLTWGYICGRSLLKENT
ncbi:MAG: FAD-binding protein [Alphaproteobacteria bacterium]|nr:FAD-binding protein [Alphaproteobacteria bacterium]